MAFVSQDLLCLNDLQRCGSILCTLALQTVLLAKAMYRSDTSPLFFLEQMHLTDALWFQRCVALKDVEIHRFEG